LREQVVESWTERHGVDHEIDLFGELEPDDLRQIAGMVRSDREDLGRIGVEFQVDDGESMVEGVDDGRI
jgi:hypothetical protein